MRLFVAVDVAPEIHAAVRELIEELRPLVPSARWVETQGMHITLKFIGETPEQKVGAISNRLAGIQSSSPVEMRFHGVGFFPNERQPRVLWVGIEATPNLAELADRIEAELEELDIPREKRAFHPHLTLARFRVPARNPRLEERRPALAAREFGRQTISEFYLYQSHLSPRGAEYRKLARFQFVRPHPAH